MAISSDGLINIYLITNKINDKQYVGQTKNLIKKRFDQHCSHNFRVKSYLRKAIDKYGKENFEINLLSVIELKDACKEEALYIDKYHTLAPDGYYAKKDLFFFIISDISLLEISSEVNLE
jgi:group I intron endonuclease